MKIEFTNGATVHQFWNDLEDGTLMAAFQYDTDAKKFAQDNIPRQDVGNSLVVVDHGTGETWRYASLLKTQPAQQQIKTSIR